MVKKKKFHTLYGQLLERPRLLSAFARVKANGGAPGSDGVTLEAFESDLEHEITQLRDELRQKIYQPQPIRRVKIPKRDGGERKLGIPSVRDRVVQENLRNILEKIFEGEFSDHSHGFRSGRSCFSALRDLFVQVKDGGIYIVDVDVAKCFDTIPHEALIDAVAEEVADRSILNLIRIFLTSPVRDGFKVVHPKQGTTQGSPLSPLLSNIYLALLDERLEHEGINYVRYADDIRATAKTPRAAREAKEQIDEGLKRLGLSMNLSKTKLTTAQQGVNFLGYRLSRFRGKVYALVPRDRVQIFRNRVRQLTRYNSHLTRDEQLAVLSRYVRGWGGYFKRAKQPHLFGDLDGWIYRRVIAMYAGRWRSWLFIKYPKRYFREKGLPSLYRMHMEHFNGPWVPRSRATSSCSA